MPQPSQPAVCTVSPEITCNMRFRMYAAAMADPMLGLGSPLWTLPTLTPPGPDLQQSTANAGNQPAARMLDSLPPSNMQPQSSWDHNNMQVGKPLKYEG